MIQFKPFRAIRPEKSLASAVPAPPESGNYETGRQLLKENPLSYLQVVKPHLLFDGEEKNPQRHFPEGARRMESLMQQRALIRDENPGYYVYRSIKGSQAYTGIIGAASVDDYLQERILKHENTLTEKQQELVEHLKHLCNVGSPVLVTYPDNDAVSQLLDAVTHRVPEYNFITSDQIKHNLWIIDNPEEMATIGKQFGTMEKVYIADGHHRSAGAAAYSAWCRQQHPGYSGNEAFNFFPVCMIPFSRLMIYEYHRLVKKVGVDQHTLLSRVQHYFSMTPSGQLPIQPLHKGEFGLYAKDKSWTLELKPEWKKQGVLEALDVSVVEEFLLNKCFGISDSKTDDRLSFLDGSKGIGTLGAKVDSGAYEYAITLFPTSVEEVKAVADAGLIMPPKSTWIEPKIRTGLVIYEMGS